MKANELMVGDFIRTCKDRIIKVESITTERQHRKVGYYRDGDCCHIKYARLASCEPIPLTEEILNANGFKDYTEIKEYQFEENGEKYKFYLKKMYNKQGICDSWGTNICGVLPSLIFYVHELQHALRLCGLNELADNFKVE